MKPTRLIALLLAAVMLLSIGAFAAPSEPDALTQMRAEADARLRNRLQEQTAADEPVTIIVELGESDGASPLGLGAAQLPSREEVKSAICALAASASPLSEDAGAESVSFGYDYDVLLDGFAVRAPASYLAAIRALPGVRSAHIAARCHALSPSISEAENAPTQRLCGAAEAHEQGYTGKGQVIAILDAGFLKSHEAFSGAVADPKLSREDVAAAMPNLNASAAASAAEVYYSQKVPFCYDYHDEDVTLSEDVMHGTHVSGIAAANAGRICGVAPDAQLLLMKVFDDNDSAWEDAILAALEDAVLLGADCVNMSFGAEGGFCGYDDGVQERVYDRLREHGVVIAAAAGNESFFLSEHFWRTPADMPDADTLSSPASYPAPLAVANLGAVFCEQVQSGGKRYPVLDAAGVAAAPEDLPRMSALGDKPVKLVNCGDGSAVPAAVKGCVGVVDIRASMESYADLCRAVMAKGGVGVVLMDGDDSWFYQTTIYGSGVTVPVIFMRQSDVREILTGATPTIAPAEGVSAMYTIGGSSWGPAPGLKLKPELAAIGTDVFSASTYGYEYASGTSMAAPQIAGEAAVLAQYLSERQYQTPLSFVELAETLLMNTATPARQTLGSEIRDISPLHQGAGLANVADTIGAKAYLTVEGSDRPKAELGDGKGPFTIRFTVHNLTAKTLSFRPETIALSQMIEDGELLEYSRNYAGKGVDVNWIGLKNGKISVPANGETTVSVRLTVGDAFRKAVSGAKNGAFLDGFVRLHAADGSGSDLGLPFLAFYGSWDDAPVLDADGRVRAARLDSFFDEPLAANPAEYIPDVDYTGEIVKIFHEDASKASISPYSWQYQRCGCVSNTVLLRAAAEIETVFRNDAGEVVIKGTDKNIRRAVYDYDDECIYNMERDMRNAVYAASEDENGDLRPAGSYTYTVRARAVGCTRWDEITHPVQIDPAAPDVGYDISGKTGSRTLTITVSDDFALCWFDLTAPGAEEIDDCDLVCTDVGLDEHRYDDLSFVRSVTWKNGKATLKLDLDAFLKELKAEGKRTDLLYFEAYDYALNRADLIIPLAEDLYPAKILLDVSELYLYPGGDYSLEWSLVPDDTKHDRVEFRSADPSVASVDANGVVTGLAIGETQIIAVAEAPAGEKPVRAVVNVTVWERPEHIYAVSFDPNGGRCGMRVNYFGNWYDSGAEIDSLPEPERDGWIFLGWFTERTGGEEITIGSVIFGDLTVYAHWTPDTGETDCPSSAFTDVDHSASSWYHFPVDWAVLNGITKGTSETTFSPSANCTRAQVVTFLWRAAGEPAPQTERNPFRDVKQSAYYYNAVLWAVEQGITKGTSETTFSPSATCTRAQVVTFLWRFEGGAKASGRNPFGDVKKSDWFYDAVLWAVSREITKGVSETSFAPGAGCTRAQVVTFLYRDMTQ